MKKKIPAVADIIRIMEEIAPFSLAEEWDNSGLQLGDSRRLANRIRIALDPTPEVVENACRCRTALLITHHPLLFRPLRTIDFATPLGKIIRMAASHQMAIVSAHTNLDSVTGGVNDILFDKLGLKKRTVLVPAGHQPTEGLGRMGELDESTDLISFARRVKNQLAASAARVVGKADLRVRKVAVCSGSGAGLLDAFFHSDADVFVTGDIRYHDAREVESLNRGVIDISHFISEAIILDVLRDKLAKALSMAEFEATITVCNLEKDPFVTI